MMYLYITADKIGEQTGGGLVTAQELQALQSMGESTIWLGRDQLEYGSDPWGWDEVALKNLQTDKLQPRLTHFYSGSMTKTVKYLKELGVKVGYTCAAHRVSDSKLAHERLGLAYNYPHLTDPKQWEQYSQCYRDADVLVVPSRHSETVVREQGCTNRVEVIPHGCHPYKGLTAELPKRFVVGYLGAIGPDKGLRFLLEAWSKLNYKDGTLLIAGKDSGSYMAKAMVESFATKGSVCLLGWQDNLSSFYNRISLYVQPSATEGFGIEVLEAMAHGRVALCSDHAGAVDVVHPSASFPASNSNELAAKIHEVRSSWDLLSRGEWCRAQAANFTWDKIRQRYVDVWKSLL